MNASFRLVGWGALIAGIAFIGQPLVVALIGPAVFGTSDLVTDPAVRLGTSWFAGVEGGIFLGVTVGLALLVIGLDDLAGSGQSVGARLHLYVGLAAVFGWFIVAATSVAHYSSLVGTAAPFSADGRSAFFLASYMDTMTGVVLASIASGLWWIGCATRAATRIVLGRPLAIVAGSAGALFLLPNLIGIPWGLIIQIPLFIAVGLIFLRRAARSVQTPALAA